MYVISYDLYIISANAPISCIFKDGTIEQNIPSVELFPIHHLDDLEFFPGDMVIRNSGRVQGGFATFL